MDEPEVTVEELDEIEGRMMFEARCRELLGISTAEFMRGYTDGTAWLWYTHEAVVELYMLIPFLYGEDTTS